MRMFRKDEGFTLVELMVVVLIIGILVAIAIPVFSSAQATARRRTCQANQRTIAGSIQQYVAAGGDNAEVDCDDDAWVGVLVNGTTAYIKVEPVCPTEGGHYWVSAGEVVGDEGAATWVVADHELGS